MFQRFFDLKKVEKHWPRAYKNLNPALIVGFPSFKSKEKKLNFDFFFLNDVTKLCSHSPSSQFNLCTVVIIFIDSSLTKAITAITVFLQIFLLLLLVISKRIEKLVFIIRCQFHQQFMQSFLVQNNFALLFSSYRLCNFFGKIISAQKQL